MAGVGQRDRRESHRLRFLYSEVDGLRRDRLAETEAAVDDGDDRRVDETVDRLTGDDIARTHPIDIARYADHAVTVVPGHISVDKRDGDASRFVRTAADMFEHLGAEIGELVSGDVNRHVEAFACPPPR
jgi:hypothetical protein